MTRRIWRIPLFAIAVLSMAWGIWLGLLRLGWALPLPWPDQLVLHGPLMIGGFLGTLIGLERAIGLAKPWAYLAPICSASGALALVAGAPPPVGSLLISLSSLIVAIVFVFVSRREPSLWTSTMLIGALGWIVGNIMWLTGAAIYREVPYWIGFVVLTIAGERLELGRVVQLPPRVHTFFGFAMAATVGGVIIQSVAPMVGARAMAVGLLALALWLVRYDLARRTVRQKGLTRFIAVCLLTGYLWLGVAGGLLFVTTEIMPSPTYDAILHSIFIGFVVSMIFGHAPIVLPAITAMPLPYRPIAYLSFLVLQASVALRLFGDLVDELGRFRAWGGLLSTIAIVLFVVTTARAVAAGRSGRHALLP